MTRHVHIKNFKCFDLLDLPLGSLSVLCGRNGAGKSSFVQAILLHRAAEAATRAGATEVALNGPVGLALGNAFDIVYRGPTANSKGGSRIEVAFGPDDTSLNVVLDIEVLSESANAVALVEVAIREYGGSPWDFIYLSAERTGPRIAQERLSNLPTSSLAIGEYGENAAEVLHRFERVKVRDALLHPLVDGEQLRTQNTLLNRHLELWLSSIFGPTQVRVEATGAYTPPAILVRGSGIDDWVRATNFGFGVTYSLPILLAGLLVREGGVLIVDGPEAHLHPGAQAAMARFLAFVAASGCTVIVETHSDHIVDGIRLAVISEETRLRPTDVTFLNFDRNDVGSVEVKPISMTPDGNLAAWPRGFFDQQSLTLRRIADVRRR